MEVANASMYDGSTACGEAVLMAHRVTRRSKAVLSGGLHPHYADVCATLARMAGDSSSRAAPRPAGERGHRVAAIDDETTCVVVQTPDVFGNLRDLDADRRGRARAGRAADRGVHRGRLARRAELARRDGRRHRRRRGPVDRQRADLRRPLCRPVRHARRNTCARCRAGLRRDRRRRRPARLRADAVDPRAAHPPREGDLQHLHQLRPLRARLHHPPDAARRERA